MKDFKQWNHIEMTATVILGGVIAPFYLLAMDWLLRATMIGSIEWAESAFLIGFMLICIFYSKRIAFDGSQEMPMTPMLIVTSSVLISCCCVAIVGLGFKEAAKVSIVAYIVQIMIWGVSIARSLGEIHEPAESDGLNKD